MLKNTHQSYGSMAKFFHWTSSILIICLLIVGAIMGDLSKTLKPTVYNVHKLIGLAVLVLVLLRLLWRFSNTSPTLSDEFPRWMRLAAYVSHRLLYLLIVIMPVSGWVMSSAAGPQYHPHLFGVSFGLPIATSKAIASAAKEVHEIAAWCLFGLLLVHISAALYHHFVRQDGILQRMLPGDKTKNDN